MFSLSLSPTLSRPSSLLSLSLHLSIYLSQCTLPHTYMKTHIEKQTRELNEQFFRPQFCTIMGQGQPEDHRQSLHWQYTFHCKDLKILPIPTELGKSDEFPTGISGVENWVNARREQDVPQQSCTS